MLTSFVVSVVKACTRFASLTVLISFILAAGAGYYTYKHFGIDTDMNKLISHDLDWRKRDIAFDKAFDQERLIITVVEAPTPEFANAATAAMEKKLQDNHSNFDAVRRLGAGDSFSDKSYRLSRSFGRILCQCLGERQFFRD